MINLLSHGETMQHFRDVRIKRQWDKTVDQNFIYIYKLLKLCYSPIFFVASEEAEKDSVGAGS